MGSGPDVGSDKVVFQGVLVDFKSKTPKEGVNLLVLNNETGAPLDLVQYPQFKSGAQGRIELQLPKDILVAFKAWGKDVSGYWDFKETYLFNVPSDAQQKRIYAVDRLTYNAALSTSFVVETDPKTYGHLAGTIYWVNAQGVEEFVGCLRVEVVDADGKVLEEKKDADGRGTFAAIRYFDTVNDTPTALANADMTHLLNSRYLIANLPDGRYTIRAKRVEDGTVLGEISVRAFPGGISVGNFYLTTAEFPVNPTPAREECKGKEPE